MVCQVMLKVKTTTDIYGSFKYWYNMTSDNVMSTYIVHFYFIETSFKIRHKQGFKERDSYTEKNKI